MQQLTCPVSQDTCAHTVPYTLAQISRANEGFHQWGGGGHKDVFTEYTRWAGDCSLGFPVPRQPQHGVHLSMMKALRTGFSGNDAAPSPPTTMELKA